ncbi:serine/threonine protein kinase [Hyalangium rubrum]|uniref:non-specific serine/threonine protein kinase n=1 Tax=Hyalangium rubrum TaxID=3103134 RepID=A0ABU5H613_9BACT|nr:serine/threonine-protein kinase [Hyalangium sp. s54d21]MDY7228746.1 serine/threonine-protein kinase [Hyalangium sp. s54d21]
MSPSLSLASDPNFESGALIDQWRVIKRFRSGSYGVVYRVVRAEQPEAGTYALKLARNPEDERFEREAMLLSRIHHPAVPQFHGHGLWKDVLGQSYPYVVMQWVEGVPLYEWADQRSFTSRQVLLVLAQVARALEATHLHGVHRDVKGDNVLVGENGQVFLVDFGACWYAGARPLTDSAIPPGTEPYRSHQLIRFRYQFRRHLEAHYHYPPEDDLYALGVMAYRLVTGTYPPAGTDPECSDDPERPRPPRLVAPRDMASVVPVLDSLILQMLSEERSARGTAGELAQSLKKAAASVEPELDLPIVPNSSTRTTERATRPGPPSWFRRVLVLLSRWLVPSAALAAVTLVTVLSAHLMEDPPQLTCGEQPAKGRAGEPVGLGDTTLASAAPFIADRLPVRAVSLDMPDRPLKGQKRAPCVRRREVEINGGCWIQVGTMEAPCEADAYDWQGKCYLPVSAPLRQPTSKEP